jgi:hypothetical protein
VGVEARPVGDDARPMGVEARSVGDEFHAMGVIPHEKFGLFIKDLKYGRTGKNFMV